jgi:hypothetical protein
VTYSALTGDGVAAMWDNIIAHRHKLTATGAFAARRRQQQVKWMWALLDDRLRGRLSSDPALKTNLPVQLHLLARPRCGADARRAEPRCVRPRAADPGKAAASRQTTPRLSPGRSRARRRGDPARHDGIGTRATRCHTGGASPPLQQSEQNPCDLSAALSG